MWKYEFYMSDGSVRFFRLEKGMNVTSVFENGFYQHKYEDFRSETINAQQILFILEFPIKEGESHDN